MTVPLPEQKWSMFCTKCGHRGPAELIRVQACGGRHFVLCDGDCGYLAYATQAPFTEEQMHAHAAAVSAANNAALREALEYAIKQVPELATVPGISAALKGASHE